MKKISTLFVICIAMILLLLDCPGGYTPDKKVVENMRLLSGSLIESTTNNEMIETLNSYYDHFNEICIYRTINDKFEVSWYARENDFLYTKNVFGKWKEISFTSDDENRSGNNYSVRLYEDGLMGFVYKDNGKDLEIINNPNTGDISLKDKRFFNTISCGKKADLILARLNEVRQKY
jgi:hypothetical protein